MAILRMKEISGMSSEDRAKKLVELRAELSRLRTMISAGGAVENPTRVRELRKTIARILTVEHEFKLGIRKSEAKEKEPKKPKAKKAKAAKPKAAKEKKPA
jgi:large subunit ribosomal protein L29